MAIEYKCAPLTKGNLNNNHIYLGKFLKELPSEVIGGANKLALASQTLLLRWADEAVRTDIAGDKKIFRDRGLVGRFLKESGAEEGDVVILEEIDTYEFRLHLQKRDGRRVSSLASVREAVPTTAAENQQYAPSNGIVPSFGMRSSIHADGPQSLYVAIFKGDTARLLGKSEMAADNEILVKVGMSNDTERRVSELNAGFPPSAQARWKMEWLADFPSGKSAFETETALKTELARVAKSQGGEFFLGNSSVIKETFNRVSGRNC